MTHEDYMQRALALADRGRGWTAPNPLVGAVVVNQGNIVGEGWHQAVGGSHAEVHALNAAGAAARGATLYVTLEPCNHFGRTPPCTRRILEAGIQRVVVALNDPNPQVEGGGNAWLRQQGLEVLTGIREAEARRQNDIFIKFITTGQPFVALKCAATLDGRIAPSSGKARWITCAASRQKVHELRQTYDAILVGSGTVRQDDPSLTTRLEGMATRNPARIVLDTHLSCPLTAKVLRVDADSVTFIVCGPNASPPARRALEAAGAVVLPMPLNTSGYPDVTHLMPELARRGVTSILIEGGSRVNAAALQAGIVDKVILFYAPKIMAGDDGFPICRGTGARQMDECLRLKDIQVARFEDDVMIEGYMV